nr:axoneme-associated protein mst101(3)-like isoform X1 [Rhipicephalus microplus]
MAEVGKVECLTATVLQARSVMQCNPSIAPFAGGDVTAVASKSPTGKKEAEDKAAKRRAREAARKRAKRAADSELRAREAAAKRQRRAQNPEICARYAAARRQRRAENAELRAREAAEKRRRRATNPHVKRRENECRRRRRQADLAAARALDRATQAAARARRRARLKQDFEDHNFGNNCTVEIGESLNSSTCPKSTQEQAESSRPSKRGVDVAVETPRISDENLCKSSQASIVPIRIHRWTETKPLVHFLVLKLQKKV